MKRHLLAAVAASAVLFAACGDDSTSSNTTTAATAGTTTSWIIIGLRNWSTGNRNRIDVSITVDSNRSWKSFPPYTCTSITNTTIRRRSNYGGTVGT